MKGERRRALVQVGRAADAHIARSGESNGDVMAASTRSNLAADYPSIHKWVFGGGWIEIGQEVCRGSFARALDEGGMVWEGKRHYKSLEDAFQDLDQGITRWLEEQG